MRGKRGWLRILETTIAVMIVASVMLVSYTEHLQQEVSLAEYSQSLQNGILFDIVSSVELRLDVLNVSVDNRSDSYYVVVDDFVNSRVPVGFGYLLRICNIGDVCKMDSVSYLATLDKDIFVEDKIISSEIGVGGGVELYNPKKVRLFFWEGSSP